ncbi:MAG: hypothetical protein IT430_18825 [Phycisphaerales bacterium]|nr:hypothetical protein [Phycisphaerales bacterium]
MQHLEMIERLRFERRVREGEFISAPEVKKALTVRARAFRKVMESLSRALEHHPELDDLDHQIRRRAAGVVDALVQEALEHLAAEAARAASIVCGEEVQS